MGCELVLVYSGTTGASRIRCQCLLDVAAGTENLLYQALTGAATQDDPSKTKLSRIGKEVLDSVPLAGELVLVYRWELPVCPASGADGGFWKALFAIQETGAGGPMEGVKRPDWNCHPG